MEERKGEKCTQEFFNSKKKSNFATNLTENAQLKAFIDMKIKHLFLLLLSAPLMWSCGDDDVVTPTPDPSAKVDQPHSIIGNQALPYAQRMEVPAIKDPTMYVVHYTDYNGVTYTLEWDKNQKTQRWSAYSMNKSNNKKGWDRKSWNGATWKGYIWSGDPFQEDSIILADYRTKLEDYKSSGYTRGHIVNSNDRLISQSANGQTFYLSNMQPQRYNFNAGVWLNMENKVHTWGTGLRAEETLYIAKGGTTQPTTKCPTPFIDDSRISIKVPKYFFMAILKYNSSTKVYQAIAFWAEHKENSDTKLKKYTISVNELEERTGINFFPNLDDRIEEDIERDCTPSSWGIYE